MTFSQIEENYKRQRDGDTEHSPQLFADCLAFAKERIDASDPDRDEIAADATWKTMQAIPTLKTGQPFAPWFLTVIRNTHRDAIRKRNTRSRHEDAALRVNAERAVSNHDAQVIRQRVAHDDYATVATELLLLGNTLDEVADSLDTTVRTLRRHLLNIAKEKTDA